MKILFVSTLLNPLDRPINGDAQRTLSLLKACVKIAPVDVVTFAGEAKEEIEVGKDIRIVFEKKICEKINVQGRWKKWVAVFPTTGMENLFPVNSEWETVLDGIIQSGNYDYIVSRYFSRTASCGLLKYFDKLVVDFDDALPFFFLNMLTPNSVLTTRVRLHLAARKAKTIARRTVRQMHAAFFANETVAASCRGVFLPNIPFYMGDCADADMGIGLKRMVFVGQLEYPPNKEGLDHFLEYVYLPLRERLPKVELHLVGLIHDEALRQRWQRYPGVIVTGFVDDLQQEYTQSHVVVVPVYRCGATNIKLLEAMSMNRACVTTVEAYEKVQGRFMNGEDLYAASSDEDYVVMLTKLLTDEKENLRIAHNGKAAMGRYYSVDSFAETVKKAIVGK